tara:strand:- start:8561 stop:9016 length:456 start_codon:yes stop_codon:yes gene_type:complete
LFSCARSEKLPVFSLQGKLTMTDHRLNLAAWALILFGLFTTTGAVPVIDAGAALFLDLVFLPLDGSPVVTTAAERLLLGILGGVTTGWGVVVLMLARGKSARVAVLWGGVAWFVVDSTASVLAGGPMNAVYNLSFLAVFLYVGWPRRAKQA